MFPRILQTGARRLLCTSGSKALSDGERVIFDALKTRFPSGKVHVQDVSGGCGSMYEVAVFDWDFKGLPLVRQHKLVSQALKKEIADMHGIRISTALPDKEDGNS